MNKLVESTSLFLNRIPIVESYEDSSIISDEHDEIPSDMDRTLHDFMFHVSSPMDPYGMGANLNALMESKTNMGPGASKNTQHPFTMAIIQRGREAHAAMGNINLHQHMHEGLRKADLEMSKETPEETAAKLKISKKHFNEFTKSLGYKSELPLMNGNTKTKKSAGKGVFTTGLNLAPHGVSGLHKFDVCPRASSECRAACLGTEAGGNRTYPKSLAAKIVRTQYIAMHPEHAARLIDDGVKQHIKLAKKMDMIPGIRMNITSDIAWEKHMKDMFERHKEGHWYDYSKMHNRVLNSLVPADEGSHFNKHGHPKNYHLTLSHTGTGHAESNDHHAIAVLERGGVVAAVHQKPGKKGIKPTHFEDVQTGKRYPAVGGDKDDNTFDRHEQAGLIPGHPGHGVVSALELKGIKNENAGHFANKVDEDGVVRINHPR